MQIIPIFAFYTVSSCRAAAAGKSAIKSDENGTQRTRGRWNS